MSKPQQPELRRSGETPSLNPDAIGGELEAHDQPGSKGPKGPVPEANKAGTPSGPTQDKPDMDAFAAKLGIVDDEVDDTRAEERQPSAVRSLVATVAVPPLNLLARGLEATADALSALNAKLEPRG